MKSISIRQPWASLIIHGIKDIENRTWACPKKYIGQRVLIHASTNDGLMKIPPSNFLNDYQIAALIESGIKFPKKDRHLYGSIIGSVEIIGCSINHPSIWADKTENYTVGMNPKLHEQITGKRVVYNWVLANPVLFKEPIPAKGKLSFWDFDGIKEVKIECPECGSVEIVVEDYTTAPFPTFLHSCNKCGYMIMESEWNVSERYR